MTALELKEKITKQEATEADLFDYFQVKNIQGLEMHLYEKFKIEKHNNQYLLTGFKSIFSDLNYENYNPLQEEYMFYFIVTKGIYDFPSEDYNFMIDILGVFKTLEIMKSVLMEKDSVKYYKELYKNYLDKTFNMNILINSGIDKILKFLDKAFQEMNKENLNEMLDELTEKLKKLDLKNLVNSLPDSDKK